MSPLMNHFVRRAVPGALSVAALTRRARGVRQRRRSRRSSGDRVVPTVTLSVEGVQRLGVEDGLGEHSRVAQRLHQRLGQLRHPVRGHRHRRSTERCSGPTASRTPAASHSVSRTCKLQLGGVRTGQSIIIRADGLSTPAATREPPRSRRWRIDPTVPRVLILNPDVGRHWRRHLHLQRAGYRHDRGDQAGYRSSGPSALTRSDSSLFSVPYPKNDTVTFSFTVPASVPVGTQFTIEPFAQNRDGLRVNGREGTVTVVAAGVDNNTPLAYQTVPPRMETGDSLDIVGRDSDGLVKAIGYIVKDSTGLRSRRSTFRSPRRRSRSCVASSGTFRSPCAGAGCS